MNIKISACFAFASRVGKSLQSAGGCVRKLALLRKNCKRKLGFLRRLQLTHVHEGQAVVHEAARRPSLPPSRLGLVGPFFLSSRSNLFQPDG